MKLATLRTGSRDGELIVVSRDLGRALEASDIVPTMQSALDNWSDVEALLLARFQEVEEHGAAGFPLDVHALAAPLPRAFSWIDASSYLSHMELARRLRGAAMPENYRSEPRFYDGVSHRLLASRDPLPLSDREAGLDFEGELCVILDDVPQKVRSADAGRYIRLVGMMNDTTLRNVFAEEARKGNGNYQAKPLCSMAPVVVTPDELGEEWDGKRVSLRLHCEYNGRKIGELDTSSGMVFDFPTLIAWAARARPLGAGTLLGSGTVSNPDETMGAACIAELRMRETLECGEPATPYLQEGDVFRLEMTDRFGASVFGAIEQRVEAFEDVPAE